MGVPKRKKSKSMIRSRRNSKKPAVVASQPCPQCGSAQQPHHACSSCGYYRGRQVLTIQAD